MTLYRMTSYPESVYYDGAWHPVRYHTERCWREHLECAQKRASDLRKELTEVENIIALIDGSIPGSPE